MDKSKLLERTMVYAGQKVFTEGEKGDRAYLIQEGQIEIVKNGLVLGTLSKGELFGEMALVDDQPRMATAQAVSDASLVIITRDSFRDKLDRADPFIRALLNIFVKNIRNLTR